MIWGVLQSAFECKKNFKGYVCSPEAASLCAVLSSAESGGISSVSCLKHKHNLLIVGSDGLKIEQGGRAYRLFPSCRKQRFRTTTWRLIR